MYLLKLQQIQLIVNGRYFQNGQTVQLHAAMALNNQIEPLNKKHFTEEKSVEVTQKEQRGVLKILVQKA